MTFLKKKKRRKKFAGTSANLHHCLRVEEILLFTRKLRIDGK